MVVGLVLLTVAVFIVVDVLLRMMSRRIDQRRVRKQRLAALDLALRLEIDEQAKSLHCVEVENPKARILAVDDEPIVLESFRKILVLDGYSVSTVESGPEALGLIQKHDYDFVFTDLKMPGFDGLEVTKAVKHMRPDIDVIMITGYGTIDSAVSVMKYGAMDFVEKPFTADELTAFVNKALIRRQARIENEQPPKVHLVTSSAPRAESERVFNVPAGVFISPAHVWARIEMTGDVRIGMDDFSRKTIGEIDAIELPRPGRQVARGEGLFSIGQNQHRVTLRSPVTGKVTAVNADLPSHLEHLTANPYEVGWVCRISPDNLAAELSSLRMGSAAVAWYREEIDRLLEIENNLAQRKSTEHQDSTNPPDDKAMSDDLWDAFSHSFLRA